MKSYLGRTDLPRGLRNNNPGNIRFSNTNDWVGKIPYANNTDAGKAFEQYTELRYGIRAKMVLIYNDINARTNTIEKLILEYAPPNENNTVAYINQLVSMMGISKTAPIELTEESLIALCKAISYVENGAAYQNFITDSDYQDAIAVLDRPIKKKAKTLRSR